jgi:hypothetical protein
MSEGELPAQTAFVARPLSREALALLRGDHEAGEHDLPHPDCQLCPPRAKGRRRKALKPVS